MPAIRSQVVKKDPGARGHSNDADHEASGENHNHNSRNNWAKSVGTNSKTRGVAVVTHLVERGALTRPSWINIQPHKMLPMEQRSYVSRPTVAKPAKSQGVETPSSHNL